MLLGYKKGDTNTNADALSRAPLPWEGANGAVPPVQSAEEERAAYSAAIAAAIAQNSVTFYPPGDSGTPAQDDSEEKGGAPLPQRTAPSEPTTAPRRSPVDPYKYFATAAVPTPEELLAGQRDDPYWGQVIRFLETKRSDEAGEELELYPLPKNVKRLKAHALFMMSHFYYLEEGSGLLRYKARLRAQTRTPAVPTDSVQDRAKLQQILHASEPCTPVVVPRRLVKRVVDLVHNEFHLGIYKTLSLLRPHFHWLTMKTDVVSAVGACGPCVLCRPHRNVA